MIQQPISKIMGNILPPPENTCKLSIIIVSFNTREVTKQCLESIYSADWADNFEIIVVDNNSSDGSVDMIRNMFPDVKLIANSDNKLFSRANNQGAKIATGKYLLLLNSDTIIEKDNLQRMMDYFETLPDNVICIGPKILNPDGSLQSRGMPQWGKPLQHYASLYGLDKILPLHWICPMLDRRPNKTHRTGWVAGCCMMIPRAKYLKVGGLNENLIFYGEEPEFGYRTDRLGYTTYYYADASIIHLGGISSKANEAKKYSFEKDINEYDSLVTQTIGYKKAISVTKRTRTSLRVKKMFYKNKEYVQSQITHETKVIQYFRNKLSNNE